MGDLEIHDRSAQVDGMKHIDMRKLPAAAQEERRRQVVGLRDSGLTYEGIAVQVGLTRPKPRNRGRGFPRSDGGWYGPILFRHP